MVNKLVKNHSMRSTSVRDSGGKNQDLRPGEEKVMDVGQPDSPSIQGRIAVGALSMEDAGSKRPAPKKESTE